MMGVLKTMVWVLEHRWVYRAITTFSAIVFTQVFDLIAATFPWAFTTTQLIVRLTIFLYLLWPLVGFVKWFIRSLVGGIM
jgi:Mg2+/Co2+ transporter CorB